MTYTPRFRKKFDALAHCRLVPNPYPWILLLLLEALKTGYRGMDIGGTGEMLQGM